MSQFTTTALIGAIFALVTFFLVVDLLVKLLIKNKKRPSEIVTFVIIGLLGFVIQFSVILKGIDTNSLVPSISSVINLVWLLGIWNMKKWGTIGYTITIILVQIFLLSQNKLTTFSILLLFPLVILYYHYPKMK